MKSPILKLLGGRKRKSPRRSKRRRRSPRRSIRRRKSRRRSPRRSMRSRKSRRRKSRRKSRSKRRSKSRSKRRRKSRSKKKWRPGSYRNRLKASCFLDPKRRKYPICNRNGKVTCQGVKAAKSRAAMVAGTRNAKKSLRRIARSVFRRAKSLEKRMGCK